MKREQEGFISCRIAERSLNLYKTKHLCLLQDQEDEGVSRVRVTSRSSPLKVERVSGVVARSLVEMPKVSGEMTEILAVNLLNKHKYIHLLLILFC